MTPGPEKRHGCRSEAGRTTTWIGDWFGVTVENGHVTRLDLNWNSMGGTLSPRITELTWLLAFLADYSIIGIENI